MSGYKLLAFDMDGTLLTDSNTILPGTLKAIRQAKEKGIHITVTTGRSLQGIEDYRKILPLDIPVITCNGAMVISPDGNILFEKNLEKNSALFILNYRRRPETRLIFWCKNRLYIDRETDETISYAALSNAEYTVYSDPAPYAAEGITKILWIDKPNIHMHYKLLLSKSSLTCTEYCVSKPEFLEFFHKDVSKGTALEFLCNYLSISSEQSIAFGDGDNDVALLNAAGLGIAMGNASDAAKKAADFVTTSNETDGIALALNRFLIK